MALFDQLKGLIGTAKKAAADHPDQVKSALAKVEDAVDKQTGGTTPRSSRRVTRPSSTSTSRTAPEGDPCLPRRSAGSADRVGLIGRGTEPLYDGNELG